LRYAGNTRVMSHHDTSVLNLRSLTHELQPNNSSESAVTMTKAIRMTRATRGVLSLSLLFLLFGVQARADTVVIDFQDGTAGSAIGSFYAAQGVTFSNAQFAYVPGFPLPPVLGFSGINGPGPTNPIIINFASLQTLVTLTAIDTSAQGFLMNAYSVDGILLSSAGYLSGGPNFPVIFSVTGGVGTGISYVTVFQPLNTSGGPGGVTFDILVFSDSYTVPNPEPAPVPEPATVVLLGLGLSGLAAKLRKRRTLYNRLRSTETIS